MSSTLRSRLAAFFVPIMLVTLVGVVVVTFALRNVQSAQARLTGDIFASYSLSAQLIESALDQEAHFRGYVLTSDPALVRQYRSAAAREDRLLRQLAATEPKLRKLAQRREAVQRLTNAWRASTVEPALAAVASGQSLDVEQVRAGQRRFEEVRTALGNYQRVLLSERSRSLDELDDAARLLFVVMTVGVLLLVCAAVVLWLAMRHWVIDPLVRLGAEVERVHAGDLAHKVAVAAAPVEITTLADQVDRMRVRILEEYSLVLEAEQAAREARRLVEEQAEDLHRSNAELEQFAYVASHDLQEPLRKVASFCQLLERRYRDQLDERGVQYIDFAVDGAKRMQQLINDLLAFSRVGRLNAALVPVDLEEVLDAAMRQLDVVIEESAAVVKHDPLPVIDGDRSLLVQLFQNLLGNAIKFRGDEQPRVHIGAVERNGEWEFSCADNGIGIEEQYAEKIFVIFQRLHGREAYAGTGIGLAMCKKIVEHHGGTMWLDTSRSDGATLRWTLPVRALAHDQDNHERNASHDAAAERTADRGAVGGGRPR